MTERGKFLGERAFAPSDQQAFATFSGDLNPIHVDPADAKKTLAGVCVVHGINCVLWALDLLTKSLRIVPQHFSVEFKKWIPVGAKVNCFWNESRNLLHLVSDLDEVFFSITCSKLCEELPGNLDLALTTTKRLESPLTSRLDDLLEGQVFPSEVGGDAGLGGVLYPDLSNKLGVNTVYEIALLSNIVGMQLPGLNSLFASCDVEFTNDSSETASQFTLDETDDRFGIAHLSYQGKNIAAKITAFERPSYKPKTCEEISASTPRKLSLNGQKILVVGGSRGIGAALSRVVALLGADVVITYLNGREDAEEVCADIGNQAQGSAECMSMDVKDFSPEILAVRYDFLCYFATPKIFGKSSRLFELNRFDELYLFYCSAFERIARSFFVNGGKKIYYPSSVAVETGVSGLEEYALAKDIGEKICASLSREFGREVIVDRLDRVETDQTLSIARIPAADAVDVALKIANRLAED